LNSDNKPNWQRDAPVPAVQYGCGADNDVNDVEACDGDTCSQAVAIDGHHWRFHLLCLGDELFAPDEYILGCNAANDNGNSNRIVYLIDINFSWADQ
jgi:hypothetical protein